MRDMFTRLRRCFLRWRVTIGCFGLLSPLVWVVSILILQPVAFSVPSSKNEQTDGTSSTAEIVVKLRRMSVRDAIDDLRAQSMEKLLAEASVEDVLSLCDDLIKRAPHYTDDISYLLSCETRASLTTASADLSINRAVLYFDFCTLKDAEDAMKLLDKALQLRDPELAARFRREQVLGYDALEAKGSIATSLRTVSPADAASMETTPDVLRNESKAATNGNLLLLQGRPHEARLAFEAALNVIHDPVIRLRLYADVARAIKAEDGVIVHANEYMRKALASVINGDVEKDRLSNSVDRPTTQP